MASTAFGLVSRCLLGACLLLATLGGSANAAWVLGPEAEPALRALSSAMQAPFMEGSPGPIRVEAGQVTFHVWPGRGAPEVVTLTHDAPLELGRSIETRHGHILLPDGWSAEQREKTTAALDKVPVTVPWIALQAPGKGLTESDGLPVVDPTRAADLARERQAARIQRNKRSPPDAAPALDSALSEDNLVQGARGDAHRWSQAALRAETEGRRHHALALADVATRITPASPEAADTWHTLRARGGTAPLWPITWITLGLIFWFTATYLLSGGREGNPVRITTAVALGIAFTGLLLAQGRPPDRLRPPPVLPDVLEAPLAGLCEADPALWTERGLEIYASCDGHDVSFIVEPNSESPSGLPHVVGMRGDTRSRAAQGAQLAMRRVVSQAELTGFRADVWRGDPPLERQHLPPTGSLDRIEASIALGLILLGVLMTLWMQGALVTVVREQVRTEPRVKTTLGALAAVWLLIHLFLPGHLVMEYTGYDLTGRMAWTKALPRYGAGASWLYWWAFELFGLDHSSVQTANRLFGLLTFLPMAALLFTLLGKRGLWALALYVCLPVVWRDHVSEGIMTGTSWLLISGLAAVVIGWQRAWRPVLLPVAFAPWMAAVVCRPEVGPALAPIGLVICVLAVLSAPTDQQKRTALALVFAAVGALLSLWPHAVWLLAEVQAQQQSTGIHGLSQHLGTRVMDVFLWRNILLDGPWVAPVVLVWLAAGLVWAKGQRLWGLGLVAGTLVWWAITSVDLPDVSIPRVHIPTWLLLIPVLGAGMVAIDERARLRWLNWVLALLVAVHALWSIGTVLGAANADAEEELIRTAAASLPPDGGCLATVSFADEPPPGSTQRHFPDYLFEGHELFGLDNFAAHWPGCAGRSVALLGTRCFMTFRAPDETVVPTDGEIASCKRFRERFQLEPVTEVALPNRTDFTFPMYPDRATLPVGVYRVLGERGAR